MRVNRLWLAVRTAVIAAAFVVFAQAWTFALPSANCSGDDGDDIQDCLDNGTEVYLEQGTYVIYGELGWIRFREDDKVLTSVDGKSTLIAAHDHTGPLLNVDGASEYEISELIVDGNRDNRDSGVVDDSCDTGYPGALGSNMFINGSGWHVHHIDTINALCGSGMEIVGDNFELNSIYAANNGEEQPSANSSAYWADGITINRCDGGYVHGNYMENNTDVNMVIAHGDDCTVVDNEVNQDERYAFAGFDMGDGGYTLAGLSFQDNTVTSGYNLLTFGIAVGMHPWTGGSGTTADVGNVKYNTVSGAVTNIAVDGIGAGTITDNTLSSPQGSRTNFSCGYSANLTYGDIGSATVQSGTCRILHGSCGCQ